MTNPKALPESTRVEAIVPEESSCGGCHYPEAYRRLAAAEVVAVKLYDHVKWYIYPLEEDPSKSAIEKVLHVVPKMIDRLNSVSRDCRDLMKKTGKDEVRLKGLTARVQQLEALVQESTSMALELLGVAPHAFAKTLRSTLSDLKEANIALTRAGAPLFLGSDGTPQITRRVQWLIDHGDKGVDTTGDVLESCEALVRCDD